MGEGSWICVDGVEGAGKTTITTALAAILPVETAPEFSRAPFGRALAEAVQSAPHYISSSPVGQSLVFLGDFLEVHAAVVAPRLRAGVSVVSDRGYLSKYAYQEVVLAGELGATPARQLLDALFAHLRPPTLTIYLTAPIDSLRKRLMQRDGHCDETRQQFMIAAAAATERRLQGVPQLNAITVDTDRPIREILAEITPAVRDVISYSS
jgi:dTMP kinase